MERNLAATHVRRAGVVAALVTLVIVLLAVPVQSAPVLESHISSKALCRAATSYADGAHGGQCKAFVNGIFNRVALRAGSDLRIGSSYYSDYVAAGGMRISAAMARPGDVIQLNLPSDPDSFVTGMHTAIVLGNLGGGRFLVIDSNWRHDERVLRHEWEPSKSATEMGLTVRFWRLGNTRGVAGEGLD